MAEQKIALVTGASAGFGREITCRLVRDGYKVIATARRKEKLEQLAQELFGNIYPVVMDMADTKEIERVIQTLPTEWQDIDVLVNNAGLALGIDPIPNISLPDWDQMIQTNVIGLIHLTQLIISGMLKRKKGHILSLGSIAGTYPYPGGNVYGATKAFVTQFMLNLKTDLLGTPIRVTNIEPGLCGGTEFSEVRLQDSQKAKEVYKGTNPLTAEDIAETISWIIGLPSHVNINRIEMMPVCQAPAGVAVAREIK
ncbi:NADP-dependent 3-hydroxy acid dehydrogenase YdfG (YdfG) (PDB:3P19) [Commensalibacter communis]|uniref:SDR family NAD(P)-dependent oxidoreductase n=1 Tax=Commensalibacter communis TaxID=2972786 RepID=UPI0022FFA901|nr:SDR family NAD(P)-dependent oxidoreductase [Commensalibacter communis]CAI3945278.1 NADP-dependent 3-hydroxy acid dehydrogenase YdfG (YdfG) (PDB:3P19) [Commensalibacter communis]